MSLNFFTADQSFSNSFTAQNQSAANDRDYSSTVRKDAFKVKSREDVSSNNRDKFSEFMNAEKKREAEEARSKKTAPDNKETDAENTSKFLTREATTNADKAVLEPDISTLDFTQISALQAQIQDLLQQQGEDETSVEIVINAESGIDEGGNQDIPSILSLISSLFKDEGNSEKDDKAFDLTQHSDFASALSHVREQLDPNLPQRIIVTNLTPEQITELTEKMQDFFTGEISEEDLKGLDAISAYMVVLTPVTDKKDIQTKTAGQAQDSAKLSSIPADQTIIIPEKQQAQSQTQDRHFAQSRYDARYDATGEPLDSTRAKSDAPDFAGEMKAKSDGSAQSPAKGVLGAGEKFLQGMTTSAGTAPLLAASGSEISGGLTAQSAQSPMQPSLTNVITQSQNATQAHPATQMVSATIQRALRAGDDTNIKLRLDPPELGRVEVKMSIDKDNKTKIVLTSERAETHTMMQKDAEILNRVLSEAGVDTDGGLSFELASDSHNFNEGQHHGQSGRGSEQDSNDDLPDIETTLNWQVDPDTGRTRYNILA